MNKFIFIIGFLTMLVLTTRAQVAPTSSFDVEGIKVILKPTIKQIVHVSIYFRGGVNNYPAEKAGIEKMALKGALDCGTAKYATGIFKDKADGIGAQLNAVAGLDDGRISLNCIVKYFNEGWDLLAAAVATPVYEEGSFGIMKQKLIGELQQADGNPDTKLRTLAISSAFKGTPYAIDPSGTNAVLTGLTAGEVKNYYFGTLLNKSRIFIVVVGNVTREDITAKIKATFSALPAGTYAPQTAQAPSFGSSPVTVEERAISTNYILGIMNAPAYSSPDYVPFMLSFWELHGLMFSEIRVRRHLSYAPNADLHATLLPFADMYVSTTDPKTSVEVMGNCLRFMKNKDIARRSLNQIKALYITSSYKRQESSDALAETLGRAETLGGWEMEEQLPALIQKTTRSEMSDAFSKYVGGITWTYLGDKGKANEAMGAFSKSVN
ncbi:MAG TPA: pitrilysin family protein [Puia sp.]|nr:pitrilysin family protein [Puia sp.]